MHINVGIYLKSKLTFECCICDLLKYLSNRSQNRHLIASKSIKDKGRERKSLVIPCVLGQLYTHREEGWKREAQNQPWVHPIFAYVPCLKLKKKKWILLEFSKVKRI